MTASHVVQVTRKIKCGAGPSGTCAAKWKDFLLKYGSSSETLRDSIAELCRLLANRVVDWKNFRSLFACRLIALDKCLRVRPIGIDEVVRRLLCKIIVLVTGSDVSSLCASDQLCSGIHGMREMYEEFDENDDDVGCLLVDAENAFNSVGRVAAIWNARILWPRASRFIFNSYCGYSFLIVKGSSELFILSKEGVIQGDPLSMLLYSVVTYPLVCSLVDRLKWHQSWYADDSACVSSFDHLLEWFHLLSKKGSAYGYLTQPHKSLVIVHPNKTQLAREVFKDSGIRVVSGGRYLGGFVGDEEERKVFLRGKIHIWDECIRRLAGIAVHQPQASYVALTISLKFEWQFIQRVVPDSCPLLSQIQDCLVQEFWPKLFGSSVTDDVSQLFPLPTTPLCFKSC